MLDNYKSQSAEGISLAFLLIWFVGDVSNLIGAVWAHLVPTVVALAVYFCFADIALILQCLYYKNIYGRHPTPQLLSSEETITDPLLGRKNGDLGPPSSRRNSSTSNVRRISQVSSEVVHEEHGPKNSWIRNLVSALLVCSVGILAWIILWKAGLWVPSPDVETLSLNEAAIEAEFLGYLSAACSLG